MTDQSQDLSFADEIKLASSMVDWTSDDAMGDPNGALFSAFMQIERAISPRSIFRQVKNAVIIPATITQVRFEESSKRYVIGFLPHQGKTKDKGQAEEEFCRTYRLDDAVNGVFVKRCITGLVEGQNVLIYKVTETYDGGAKKLRIAAWVEQQPLR